MVWNRWFYTTNWALCNGSNGTPNLVDRFIVGRGNDYAAGATGGNADAIIPNHTHTATGGNHGHPVRHSTQITGAVDADASGAVSYTHLTLPTTTIV